MIHTCKPCASECLATSQEALRRRLVARNKAFFSELNRLPFIAVIDGRHFKWSESLHPLERFAPLTNGGWSDSPQVGSARLTYSTRRASRKIESCTKARRRDASSFGHRHCSRTRCVEPDGLAARHPRASRMAAASRPCLPVTSSRACPSRRRACQTRDRAGRAPHRDEAGRRRHRCRPPPCAR